MSIGSVYIYTQWHGKVLHNNYNDAKIGIYTIDLTNSVKNQICMMIFHKYSFRISIVTVSLTRIILGKTEIKTHTQSFVYMSASGDYYSL